jgi:sortase A
MSNVVYKKRDRVKIITRIRYSGLAMSVLGIVTFLYFSFPLLSWKLYFEPAFASNGIEAPVPKTAVLSSTSIKQLLTSAVSSVSTDYSNAQNWFPDIPTPGSSAGAEKPVVTTYNITIPSIKVNYANVSTIDTNLDKHLVHYPGTPLPPSKGNSVIFGHSTLPQLFNKNDYKTIFAKAHTLEIGDKITLAVDGREYTYEIFSIFVTTPDDTSIFAQGQDDSLLTIVTCTPPGTTWKRLIVLAKPDTE